MDQYIDLFRSLSATDGTLEQANLRTRVSGDLAYQTFDGFGSFTSSGSLIRLAERESIVFQRTDGQWKIALWHATTRSDTLAPDVVNRRAR